MAKVKGIFFTFGGFFLVMLVIVLSLLVATTIQQSNDRLAESGSLERLYVLDHSIQKVLSNIDNGILYKLQWSDPINYTVVSIIENLDEGFDDYGSNFYSEVQEFSNFVETDQPEITFELSKIYNSTNKIPIIVRPYNLEYSHINRGGKNVVTITPNTYMSEASVSLILENSSITNTSVNWVTQNTGNYTLNITIIDQYSNASTSTYSLNENLLNEFIINNQANITIGGTCQGCIELERGNLNITLQFLTYLPYAAEQVTLTYPKGLYLINFSDIGVSMNSTPRIL